MYRLVIVAGPNRGSSFSLIDGENSVGRHADNQIVLTSGKVSKKHCVLNVKADGVDFYDETSTNGTFVNGTLAKRQILRPGDTISVGDFVLELIEISNSKRQSPPIGTQDHGYLGNLAVVSDRVEMPRIEDAPPHLSLVPNSEEVDAPEDPIEKVKFLFEGKVMPYFYDQLMKNEFKVLLSFMVGALVVVAVIGSVMPTIDMAEKAIQQEAMIRARTLAKESVDRFLPAMVSNNPGQIDLSVLENDPFVRMVAVVDLDLQIIAPQSRVNQLLAGGSEASFALLMSRNVRLGDDRPQVTLGSSSSAIAIEPIRVVDPRRIKPVVVGLMIVSVDFSKNTLGTGGEGVAYALALTIAGLMGFLVFHILRRLFLKPFEVLNDDLDQVLRGVIPKVTQEFKIPELARLWDNVNAAAIRGLKGGSNVMASEDRPIQWEHELAPYEAIATATASALIGFDSDMNVMAVNHLLDEVAGIHQSSIGQSLQSVARDQAFLALVQDLKDRSESSVQRTAIEETEFGGIGYQAIGVAIGPEGRRGLALIFRRKG